MTPQHLYVVMTLNHDKLYNKLTILEQTLDKLVKLDLLENETPENIAKIWNAGHANKDCITAVIPSDIYDKLYKRSQEYPMVNGA